MTRRTGTAKKNLQWKMRPTSFDCRMKQRNSGSGSNGLLLTRLPDLQRDRGARLRLRHLSSRLGRILLFVGSAFGQGCASLAGACSRGYAAIGVRDYPQTRRQLQDLRQAPMTMGTMQRTEMSSTSSKTTRSEATLLPRRPR